jgi:hypothetical protein
MRYLIFLLVFISFSSSAELVRLAARATEAEADAREPYYQGRQRNYYVYVVYDVDYNATFPWSIMLWYSETCPVDHTGSPPDCTPPPDDPYACSENTRRISFDNNPSFCGSANTCVAIVDYALANHYRNGSCVDVRNSFPVDDTCGDQSILCWVSDDSENTPVVTSLDSAPTDPYVPQAPDVITSVTSNTDDPDVTHDTVLKEVEQADGSIVKESTTTSTNNITGESSTSTTTTTIDPNGDYSVAIGESSQSNEDQTEVSASGGDNCNVAPSCSGDPSTCMVAKQVWLNRCESLGEVSGDPSNCDIDFQCTGDAVECASLNFSRTQMCAEQTAADEFDTNSLSDSLSDGLTDFESELGAEPVDENGMLTSVSDSTDVINIGDSLDLSSIFNPSPSSGSCPAPYSMNLLGNPVSFSYTMFCDVLISINPFVLMLFSFFGARILYRGLSESL